MVGIGVGEGGENFPSIDATVCDKSRQLTNGLIVNRWDGRAGKDVVKLVEEEDAPERVDARGVGFAAGKTGAGSAVVEVSQSELGGADEAFDRGLLRECSPVAFEVEFANVERSSRAFITIAS